MTRHQRRRAILAAIYISVTLAVCIAALAAEAGTGHGRVTFGQAPAALLGTVALLWYGMLGALTARPRTIRRRNR